MTTMYANASRNPVNNRNEATFSCAANRAVCFAHDTENVFDPTDIVWQTNNSCRADLSVTPYCGDGVVNAGEQCDLGSALNGTSGVSCSSTCTIG